ncbi:transglutaminase family protein [Methylomonas sp. OY6]|uniref:Transglutaminase family protein n=1 Tax=Methylomonas defluvii TaxID=3045149 RepID=A0ABU4UA60_9GAMM|nr:transglutaminase family protein [Methylomonas sp. OY6]MDX8126073.1 transglutaminase family protein [Methylomonas sp. OY6]
MRYRVTHTTTYRYQQPVGLSYNEVRMQPRPCPNQQLLSSQLKITPLPCDYRTRTDFFGNQVAWFSIREPHREFVVTASSEVQIFPQPVQLDFSHGMSWELVKEALWNDRSEPLLEARQFALDSPFIAADAELAAYAQTSFTPGKALIEAIHDLMQRIHRDFTFDPEFTNLATPLTTVLEHRRGVCQDFAHLAIGCIRSQGLAARYVSGYIETLPPPGKKKLVGADASHAWFSVYLPDLGWMDFDPTNNQLPGDRHIIVAWGRDYSDVTPLKGVIFGGQNHELKVAVEVENLGA